MKHLITLLFALLPLALPAQSTVKYGYVRSDSLLHTLPAYARAQSELADLRRKYEDFLLLGVVGGRLDHSLGNVSILLYLDSLGKRGLIVDDYSEMEIVSRQEAEVGPEFPYFSLLNISGTARGITLENAKYTLKDAEIRCDCQYGVSNEPLPGKTARICLKEGQLLLIRVRSE